MQSSIDQTSYVTCHTYTEYDWKLQYKGNTLTTVNQPVLVHGTSVFPDTTPLKNMEHLKDMQIASALQIAIMMTKSNALKKTMNQNLSLIGLIACLLIPGATKINAT